MARARWPAEPPLEVPKLISSSMSYGSCRRTFAIASMLAGAGPPGPPKSAACANGVNVSTVTRHQVRDARARTVVFRSAVKLIQGLSFDWCTVPLPATLGSSFASMRPQRGSFLQVRIPAS